MTRWRTAPPAVLLATAAAAAAGVAGAAALGWGHPAGWAPPALAAATVVSEITVVHLAFGRQRWTFSCTDGLVAAALVLAPGAWVGLALAAGVLLAQLARRQPAVKAVFNVAQFAAAAAAAEAVDALVHPKLLSTWPAVVLAMAAFWLVNHSLVACAVAATSRRGWRDLLARSAGLSLLHAAGNTSVGLLAAWLALHAPLGLTALLVPVLLLWSSYDQQTLRAAEAALFAALAEGQERVSGRSVDVSAQVLVATAADVLGGADVELLLLDADGLARYSCSAATPVRRSLAEPDALDAPWALRALGSAEVLAGVEGGRGYLSARVGPAEEPLALLRARRVAGTGGPSRREALLLRILVRQATSWLSVAGLAASRDAALSRAQAAGETARVLSDLGADTAPALLRLRDSAGRLARLADTAAEWDCVEGIVAELHSVERAVASLLGALTLAAVEEPAAAGGAGEEAASAPAPGSGAALPALLRLGRLRPRGAESEWTSSGVLA